MNRSKHVDSSRWSREKTAKDMMDKGIQPHIIKEQTGLNMLWIESEIRKRGGQPMGFQVVGHDGK